MFVVKHITGLVWRPSILARISTPYTYICILHMYCAVRGFLRMCFTWYCIYVPSDREMCVGICRLYECKEVSTYMSGWVICVFYAMHIYIHSFTCQIPFVSFCVLGLVDLAARSQKVITFMFRPVGHQVYVKLNPGVLSGCMFIFIHANTYVHKTTGYSMCKSSQILGHNILYIYIVLYIHIYKNNVI